MFAEMLAASLCCKRYSALPLHCCYGLQGRHSHCRVFDVFEAAAVFTETPVAAAAGVSVS